VAALYCRAEQPLEWPGGGNDERRLQVRCCLTQLAYDVGLTMRRFTSARRSVNSTTEKRPLPMAAIKSRWDPLKPIDKDQTVEELFQATNERGVPVAYYNSINSTPAGANATKEILPVPIPQPAVDGNPDLTIRSGW
jgi:hypothetical protein